jgi:hypothetical protein
MSPGLASRFGLHSAAEPPRNYGIGLTTGRNRLINLSRPLPRLRRR